MSEAEINYPKNPKPIGITVRLSIEKARYIRSLLGGTGSKKKQKIIRGAIIDPMADIDEEDLQEIGYELYRTFQQALVQAKVIWPKE